MSSFDWPEKIENGKDVNNFMGPPSNEKGETLRIKINEDGTCSENWICEHRWHSIKNMIKFRNVVGDSPVSEWWDNTGDQVNLYLISYDY